MPIGSGAVYAPANLQGVPQNQLWANLFGPDPERIVMTPTAPMTTFNYSSAGWSGANRCGATGGTGWGLPVSVPMPTNYVVPSDNTNSGAVFLMPDGRTIKQMQPIARCTAGGSGTALVAPPEWVVDIYGDGIRGGHGGSGMSSIGGSFRVGEMRPGQQGMKHAVKINLDGSELYPGVYAWPADRIDTGYTYSGSNPAMKMGALLAIPPTISISSLNLESEPGRQLAWTLQNYGAYIVDTYNGCPCMGWSVEDGPGGSFSAQFKSDYGLNLAVWNADNTVWSRDIAKLRTALRVVSNNSPTSIGGGGTPRQPLAPAI